MLKRLFLSTLILFFLFSAAFAAEESEKSIQSEEDVLVLEDVEVKESLSSGSSGKTEIHRELLKNIPKIDGTVSDLLRSAPSVQYDIDYRSSSTGGEIEPADISISGGRPYENLFLIDGMSNSNMMNPGGKTPANSFDNVGSGNPQKFFIDSWLIEDITLYDSNISAAYGDFTGGVVQVKTKNPTGAFGGKLAYKTTRSGWSHIYVDKRDREYFRGSDSPELQPHFRKDVYSASLNIPITANTGVLASYNRKDSIIPLGYFREYRDTERLQENYFIKALHNIDGSSYLDISAIYSPYIGKFFLSDHIDGDYEIHNGGYAGIANYHLETEGGGEIKLHADYSFQENSRTGSKDYHMAWTASRFKPWGAKADEDYTNTSTSYEGGPGDISEENGAASLKFDHSFGKFSFLGEHKLSYGAGYNYIFGRHVRAAPSTFYIHPTPSPNLDCGGDSFTCVDGDQYFALRQHFPASNVYAQINEYAAYIEDEWEFSRVKLRGGVRVSGDDYMNNINFAPRTEFQWDLFNDSSTLLTLGYSRYYSANLLENKLQEGITPSIMSVRWTWNNKVTDWMPSKDENINVYNFRELKTPYTDEYTAAVEQAVFSSTLSLKYIERAARDEFASEESVVEKDGLYHNRLNNNGTSDYKALQLKWEKVWKNHLVMFNAVWSESKTSNNSYDDLYGLEELETEIIFNGKPIKRKDLPKDNFNRPYIFNLSYVGRYFDRLIVSGVFSYSTAHRKLYSNTIETGNTTPEGPESIAVYRTVEIDDALALDCSFSWEQKVYNNQKIILTLEVLNILDAKNKIGESSRSYYKDDYNYDIYQMGRQFWAGIAYEF